MHNKKQSDILSLCFLFQHLQNNIYAPIKQSTIIINFIKSPKKKLNIKPNAIKNNKKPNTLHIWHHPSILTILYAEYKNSMQTVHAIFYVIGNFVEIVL